MSAAAVLTAALLEGKALTGKQAADIEFVRKITQRIADDLCAKIEHGHVPEHWDGHEFRQWLADRFTREVYREVMKGKRKQQYKNDCYTFNL